MTKNIENTPLFGILFSFHHPLHPILLGSRIVYSFSVKKYCPLAVAVMEVSDTDYRKVLLLTECSLQCCESSQEEAFQYFYLYTRSVLKSFKSCFLITVQISQLLQYIGVTLGM